MYPRSPLAPDISPVLPAIDGAIIGTYAAGLRYQNRPDVLLVSFPHGATAAGVFTTSHTAAAPVQWCRQVLKNAQPAPCALVVNAGNANAFTGDLGLKACQHTARAAAQLLGIPETAVYLCSTGVIGEPLPTEKLAAALPHARHAAILDGWQAAAQAIMTTDTFPKLVTRSLTIDGHTFTINGIAKGSGMIQPNMATMLAFIVTDAMIPHDTLQAMLQHASDETFNCITVDGDTSTNDTLLAFATGTAGTPGNMPRFATLLTDICRELALLIVRDGEGAQKLITITVRGTSCNHDARTIGLTIANSPLVKTAIAGEDANWGRIVAAAGRAGIAFDQRDVGVAIGGIPVAAHGQRVIDYDETPVAAHIRSRAIDIEVTVGHGTGHATVWTCDLTHQYLDINAGYRS